MSKKTNEDYRRGYEDGIKRAAEFVRTIYGAQYMSVNLGRLAERIEALPAPPEMPDEH